ncbi:MAG: TldD/PmbA family protein [Myxococcota bacterium]
MSMAPFAPGAEHAVDESSAHKLLSEALREGGDFADLFFEYRAAASLGLEDGIIKSASRSVSGGLGVRVQKGDATGFAYTESLAWGDMLGAARTAAKIASGSQGQPAAFESPAQVPMLYHFPRSTDDAQKAALLKRADKSARAHDSRITKVTASYAESNREILIATSDGHFVRDAQPMMRFGVNALAEEDGRRQSGSSGGGGRMGVEYFLAEGKRPEDHGREAARIAVDMLHAEDAPAGEFPVVLAAGDSGILLHEAVGHGLEADFNRKGTSRYADSVGESVASELVTVVDDPIFPGARGAIHFDDEGRPGREVRLIEGGVLKGYMHDQHSAKHFKTVSGNGRRESFRCPPMPRMTNTIMLGGPHTAEEIISETKQGIFAKRFSGGQVDITNGDFVFSLTESYLIEDGKLTAPLKGVNLIGNGPDVLGRVDMLAADVQISDGIWTCGKDGQSVPVGVGCPTTRIAHMTVGGTKM